MSRRGEVALYVGFLAATVVVATLGALAGRDTPSDGRASVANSGPQGAMALADVLTRLGVETTVRSQPLFAVDEEQPTPGEVLAFLDLTFAPTEQERVALSRYVEQGGHVFIAGYSWVEQCFGYEVKWTGQLDDAVPTNREELPGVSLVLESESPDSLMDFTDADVGGCAPLAARPDTVVATEFDEPVALSLVVLGETRVKLLSDASLIRNSTLRDTDAGLFVIPWLIENGVERVVFDEYHHAPRRRGSLVGASVRWLSGTPGGWAILHLMGAGLLAIAATAVRFGRPVHLPERSRRSELEHVDALASGLRRVRGEDTAVALIIRGLRRRLGQPVRGRPTLEDHRTWLETLTLTTTSPDARTAIGELEQAMTRQERDRVTSAAQAVDRLWTAMRSGATSATS